MNKNHSAQFNGRMARSIVRGVLVAFVALAATGIASAQGNDIGEGVFTNEPALVQFKGAIGVIPVTGVAANGAVNLNVVRGINPAGPWRISDLAANVRQDGHIRVQGRRLLLAAGNGIGTNAGAKVFATLFCGSANMATAHSSTPVALEANGDFTIDDFLSPVPTTCPTPVLLIRNASGTGVWFAAGIPRLE